MAQTDGEGGPAGEPAARPMVSGLLPRLMSLATIGLVAAAVLRWRTLDAGAWIWLGAFVAAMVIRAPHIARNGANRAQGAPGPAGDSVLAFILVVALMLPLLHLATGGVAALDYRLPPVFLLAGALLQIPYLWLFYRAHADLRRNWSPGLELRDGHELVTHGIYGRIRHPMYAAVLLSAAAQPLLIQNWLAGPPALLVAIAFCRLRVPAEERMMAAHFGAAYAAYRARTGCLLPIRRHG